MKLTSSTDAISWCMRYVGVPVTLGITMYGLCCHLSRKKRRAQLEGKVRNTKLPYFFSLPMECIYVHISSERHIDWKISQLHCKCEGEINLISG